MKSLYWWKGRVTESDEWLAIIKTRKELYPRVEEKIRQEHHYELPEIIAFEADDGLPAYGRWVMDETNGSIGEDR
jgi:periplasmic divalent cation tolerance protein